MLASYTKFVKQIFKGQYVMLSLLLTLQILAGIAPVVVAWLNGKVIDQIAISDAYAWSSHVGLKLIVPLIIATTMLIAAGDLFTVLQNFCSEYFQDLVYKRLHFQLMRVISAQETINLFENPKDHNLIAIIKQNANDVSEYVSVTSQVLVMFFSLISALYLGFSIVWWMPIVLLVTMVPFIYFRTKIENKIWNTKVSHSHTFNQLNVYDRILTTTEFAKDLRLYNMQNPLLKKWQDVYNTFSNSINSLRIKSSVTVGFWAFVSGIGPLATFWYVVNNAIIHNISLGTVSFLLGVIIQLRGSITCLMYNSADIFRTFLMIKPILSLLNRQPERPTAPTYCLKSEVPLLLFENVSFCYPGTTEYVIKNFNLSIKNGQSIAIVGENGSGKSTLLKLISRLHLPTSGSIYWYGQNINSLAFNDYRSKLAVLFQDFSKFPLSVRENIEINSNNLFSDETIRGILKDVDLNFLHDKLDTILYKGVDNGTDLSGGQWQRLALARLIVNMKNSQLVILDEPTAALDPHIEHKIFTLISKIISHKTSIIISHRLALCQFVSNIIVLKKGMIIEQGNHTTLLHPKFEYYAMFQKQASWYK